MCPDPIPCRTVLCVEDNELNALLMQALFEHRPDLHLLLAPDGATALRLARAQPPDLLLLDLHLPDGHGSALLPQLRALPGQQHVPAVAVTTDDPQHWHRQGFDALWPKPLQMLEVLRELDRLLPLRAEQPVQTAPPAPGRRRPGSVTATAPPPPAPAVAPAVRPASAAGQRC